MEINVTGMEKKRVDIIRIGNQYKSIGNGDQEAIAEIIEKDLRSLR